ncbi:maltase 2-like [Adelges cooleyi]|uniref:maltase 2-like n=1 Tax=Adelges cooleyi TaxID=133065 RepID=UPI00217FD2AC|nr:maltase 2-like [Adelges cooleyi]
MIRIFLYFGLTLTQNFVYSENIYRTYNSTNELDWWQTGIIYQIYVRSFKDTNSDGIGDLNGVTQKVDYLKDLGIGAIWLSPIFESPQYDFGYDISNYRQIDKDYGTLADFDRLLDTYHKAGIKVLLDFVPNHSSHLHEWFLKSVKRIPPFTDYYVWEDPVITKEGRKPPNNWLSVFNSGTAWEWNEERNQYYFHQFLVEQPDFNYRSPMLVEEMKNVLRFWLDRGVDGFRFDAVNALFERADLVDEPESGDPESGPKDYDFLNHIYTLDQPETYEMVHQWREVIDSYKKSENDTTRMFMVECYSPVDKTMQYYGNDTALGAHFPFNFFFIKDFNRQSDAKQMRNVIASWLTNIPSGKWPNWVIGNHDNSRIASRLDPMLVDGVHMVQMLLPGTTVTYNADELGIEDTYIRWDQTIDNAGLNVGPRRYEKFSRDPERSPFPWDDSLNAGFSDGPKPWLPINPKFWRENMKQQTKYKSHLRTYKQLVSLRKSPAIMYGDLNVFILSKWVLGFSRSYLDHPTYFVVINLGSETERVNLLNARYTLPHILKVKVSSVNSGLVTGNLVRTENIILRPKAALVLTTSRNNEDADNF